MDKAKIAQSLKALGFTSNEVDIYLTLVDYGQSKIGRIVKITGIQKSSCYMAINTLLHKGVISSVHKGEVSYYQAENPRLLLSYVDERRKIAGDIVPELAKRHEDHKVESAVKFFKGESGVKAVFHDILRSGQPNDVFGSEGQLSDRMPLFTKQYILRQNEAKIRTRNLIGKNAKRKFSKGTEYKFVDEEIKSDVVTNIYGNKVAIIIWNEEPEAVIIESKNAANSYRSYFEFMWKNAKKPKV